MKKTPKKHQAAVSCHPLMVFIAIPLMFLLTGCMTPAEKGAPPAVSLEEAKKITATFEGQAFTPPPRTINDITKILAQEKPDDLKAFQKALAFADNRPPATKDVSKLANFYFKRAQANLDIYQRTRTAKDSALQANSRSILADAILAQRRWKEALAEYDAIREALKTDQIAYKGFIAKKVNLWLALIKGGRGSEALNLALSSPEVTGGKEDGLLTMGEILGLKLNADWVVLSACNTGAGEGAGAEAVSGLGRAFFYAGTRALLVSNWAVETTSAKTLTTELFCHQTADPNLSRSEALNRTMLDLIDKLGYMDDQGRMVFSYAHPIFWAPFNLVGDGG